MATDKRFGNGTSIQSHKDRTSSTQADLALVGVIIGAHGIRGQLKLRSFTANPEDIMTYGALLNKEGTKRFELKLDGGSAKSLIVTLKGINDRNAAELMRGTELFVDRANIPQPSDDEFLYDELIGMEVRDMQGVALGTVAALYNFGASDILEIRFADSGKKTMYPFTLINFPEINRAEGYILSDLPEMLEPVGQKEGDSKKPAKDAES